MHFLTIQIRYDQAWWPTATTVRKDTSYSYTSLKVREENMWPEGRLSKAPLSFTITAKMEWFSGLKSDSGSFQVWMCIWSVREIASWWVLYKMIVETKTLATGWKVAVGPQSTNSYHSKVYCVTIWMIEILAVQSFTLVKWLIFCGFHCYFIGLITQQTKSHLIPQV